MMLPPIIRRHAATLALASVLASVLALGFAGPLRAEEKPLSPVGEWLVEDIGGGGVIDRLQTTLTLAPDGAVSGMGGCNRYHGTATLAGARLTFGPLAATRMACTPAAMGQEQKFLTALEQVQAWRYDPLRRKLSLIDLTGRELVRLSAQ